MPECRRKVSPASAFLPAVNFFSPASAFRHQGQSGIARRVLVRQCPAMFKYTFGRKGCTVLSFFASFQGEKLVFEHLCECCSWQLEKLNNNDDNFKGIIVQDYSVCCPLHLSFKLEKQEGRHCAGIKIGTCKLKKEFPKICMNKQFMSTG